MEAVLASAAIVIAYLVGSIPFSIIFARAFGGADPRTVGSRSAGATNVARTAGRAAGLLALLCDAGKGVAAVLLAPMIVAGSHVGWHGSLPVLCGSAAVVGHVFPIFAGFRGGKGVATAAGVAFSLLPVETAIALGVFAIVFAATRLVSLGSLSAALTICAVALVERFALGVSVADPRLVFAVALPLFIAFTHRANVARLLNGTEPRFTKGG